MSHYFHFYDFILTCFVLLTHILLLEKLENMSANKDLCYVKKVVELKRTWAIKLQRPLCNISSHKQHNQDILQQDQALQNTAKFLFLKETNIHSGCSQRNRNGWVQLRRHWISGTCVNENPQSRWQIVNYKRIRSTEERMEKKNMDIWECLLSRR